MAMQPMAMYGLEVPAGDVAISARPDIPSAFRITMAAIDPSAEPEGEDGAVPRATLKIIRQSIEYEDDEFDSDEGSSEDGLDELDDEEMAEMERMLANGDSEESDDGEEANGGPSDPEKSKQAKREAVKAKIEAILAEEGMDLDEDDEDDEDEDDVPNGINGMNGTLSAKAKGKMRASDEEDSEDDDEDLGEEFEEFVICTLDPTKLYQQPLDITFGDDERVWFKVSGTHSIFLTGNYVEMAGEQGMYDPDSDEEEDYDLEPDMDELDDDDMDELDELDDMEDPRITELDDEDEAPALIKAATKVDKKAAKAKANKNKRSAPDSADEDEAEAGANLDEMIANAAAQTGAKAFVNGEKLSKKQLKKLKKNDGAAAAAPVDDVPSSQKSDKKVSFAKELEQGPTPTKGPEKTADAGKSKNAPSLGVKNVQGVSIDDKKLGAGQAAKNGDRISMRYIGKLKADNKVFDSNKKGKPFTFKLGAGEVIKGWDIGVQGMQVGGERRITIPARHGYGSKGTGPIPANADLVFDVKIIDIK